MLFGEKGLVGGKWHNVLDLRMKAVSYDETEGLSRMLSLDILVLKKWLQKEIIIHANRFVTLLKRRLSRIPNCQITQAQVLGWSSRAYIKQNRNGLGPRRFLIDFFFSSMRSTIKIVLVPQNELPAWHEVNSLSKQKSLLSHLQSDVICLTCVWKFPCLHIWDRSLASLFFMGKYLTGRLLKRKVYLHLY